MISGLIQSAFFHFFQKMNQLRTEADNAVVRAEEAEAKNKKYEQLLLEKDQEITSLQHRLHLLDEELEKAEASLKESKLARDEGEKAKGENETSARKIQLLEGELDKAEKMLKDTVEKCAWLLLLERSLISFSHNLGSDKSMSKQNTLSDKCSELSRSAICGRRSMRSVYPGRHCCCPYSRHVYCDLQDEREKLRKAQTDLEELEASMQDL